MLGRVCLALAAAATLVGAAVGSVGALSPQKPSFEPSVQAPAPATEQRALLDRYCVTCHNTRLKTAGLTLDTLNINNVGQNAVVWEKVVRKMRGGIMPPQGMPRPEPVVYDGFASWLEKQLDSVASAHPNPGRKDTFHRLNRAEYRNVVRDLLALDQDVTELLPPDDASYGFDNIAGVLKVSQSLLERYLVAARKISRTAMGSPVPAPGAETFRVLDELPQTDRLEGLPFGTRGGALIHHNFPQDAQYDITIEPGCSKVETVACDAAGGFPDTHQLELTIDGERVHLFTLEPRRRTSGNNVPGGSDGVRLRVRIPVKGGPRDVGVAFLKLPSIEEADGIRARFDKPMFRAPWIAEDMAIYQPVIEKITIAGPFEASGAVSDTPSRRAILVCRPAAAAEEAACAKTILTKLARRAYRRPVTAADLDGLLAFYKDGRADGSFETGIEMALRAMLVSPQFLFRVETDPAGAAPGSNYRVNDLELASRLSFFLWSSIPDEELLSVAVQGKLRNPAVLEQQTRRMLADARSRTLTSNFASQWLQLPRLATLQPSGQLFPDFDEGLRKAFVEETQLLFDSVLRENRSVVELLTANYTFVNERLAHHYGIPNVRGSNFRRVTLSEDSPHRGLLGQGSILTLTSHAVRTSPVFRGKWILINVLGTPPPDPPANVPPLQEKKGDEAKVLTMRERMAEHRANPVCASCHSVIDPLGFALENFDPIGRWRTLDETFKPVDASGSLPDGTKFQDVGGFRAGLMRHPERFVRTATEKLLIYAMGRGLESYDMPTVRRIVADAAPGDYKLSSIVLGIVKSDPFLMRRSASPAAEAVHASVRP